MESPRQPDGAKAPTRVGEVVGAAGGGGDVRKYPKPPTLWRRILAHSVIPESWPLAARYPTRYTFIALLVAILIAGAVAGLGDGLRFANEILAIAARYQAAYPEVPLVITPEGELKATPAFKEPIQFSFPNSRIVIDPTGKTHPESIKTPTILLTNKEAIICRGNGEEMRLPQWLKLPPSPEDKQDLPITGQSIRTLSTGMGTLTGLMIGLTLAIGNVIWAAVTMFLLCPLLIVVASAGDRGLLMPRRVAYRMIAALMVPLVLFSGIMHAAGYSILSTLGGLDPALLFWFFTTAALAVWTGFMAKKIYAPPIKS
ncbi:MAG: DUF1189 domain-containing protein [Phycisphaerales bacterium]|nr:DUF1189 domain-containing protein [Phycisphaerales bacterium]